MPKKVDQYGGIGPTSTQQPNIVDGAKRKVKSKTKPSSAKKETKPKPKPSSAKKVKQDGGLFGNLFKRKSEHNDGDKQYYYIDFEQDSTIVNEAIKKNYTDLSEINEYLNKRYSELKNMTLLIKKDDLENLHIYLDNTDISKKQYPNSIESKLLKYSLEGIVFKDDDNKQLTELKEFIKITKIDSSTETDGDTSTEIDGEKLLNKIKKALFILDATNNLPPKDNTYYYGSHFYPYLSKIISLNKQLLFLNKLQNSILEYNKIKIRCIIEGTYKKNDQSMFSRQSKMHNDLLDKFWITNIMLVIIEGSNSGSDYQPINITNYLINSDVDPTLIGYNYIIKILIPDNNPIKDFFTNFYFDGLSNKALFIKSDKDNQITLWKWPINSIMISKVVPREYIINKSLKQYTLKYTLTTITDLYATLRRNFVGFYIKQSDIIDFNPYLLPSIQKQPEGGGKRKIVSAKAKPSSAKKETKPKAKPSSAKKEAKPKAKKEKSNKI
jgi:hypothetical protein